MITALSQQGQDRVLRFWQEHSDTELINPQPLFDHIVERCSEQYARGGDLRYELVFMHSKTNQPVILDLEIIDFEVEDA